MFDLLSANDWSFARLLVSYCFQFTPLGGFFKTRHPEIRPASIRNGRESNRHHRVESPGYLHALRAMESKCDSCFSVPPGAPMSLLGRHPPMSPIICFLSAPRGVAMMLYTEFADGESLGVVGTSLRTPP